MLGRKSALWLAAAAIGVLSFLALPAASAADELPCNGAVELCDRSLDQVVLPGTHNSMSNEEYGWNLPNQHYSIPTQLSMGIRAFLIDTYYGKPFNGGPKIEDTNRANSTGMFLCHFSCLLGSSPLVEELAKVRDFLAANPREVLVFMNEAKVTPDDFAQAVTESGLLPYIYTGSTDTYPTLRQMIDSGQRVVMLSEGNTGTVPWYHDGYAGPMQETPYNFLNNEAGDPLTPSEGMELLTASANLDSSCRPNRGGTTGSLFLMNHWVNGEIDSTAKGSDLNVKPDPRVAQVLNTREVLVNRARACEARRGKLPNIVAVDDFGDGDLITAVRELNGLTKPVISIKRLSGRTVKAGKKVTWKLSLSNTGEEDASAAKVCVSVPRRLAIRPGCRTVSLAQGSGRSLTFTVRTLKIFQGRFRGKKSGPVSFTVSGAGDSVRTSANLKVTPLKKKPKGQRR